MTALLGCDDWGLPMSSGAVQRVGELLLHMVEPRDDHASRRELPPFYCSMSVNVERWIFPEHIGGGDQFMLRHRAPRQRFAVQQTQRERQNVITIAVHKVRDRSEHDAAAVVGIDLLLLADIAMDVRVEPLADDDADGLP